MNLRFGAVAVLGAAMLVGGCASSGETRSPDSSILGAGFMEDDLPQWVMDLPEGIEPRDNEHTNQAAVFLLQAGASASEEQARTRYLEALGFAEAGIQADPENPQSYLQAGEALLGLGRLEEAARRLDQAEELYPRYVLETAGLREGVWVDFYNTGVERLSAGDLEGAIEAFEQADKIYDLRPEAALNLGSTYAQAGRFEDSAEAFGKVVRIVDGPWADRVDDEVREEWMGYRGPAMANRAQLLLRLERYEEAAEVYAALIEAEPDNLEYLTTYASAMVAAGRGEAAQDLFADLLSRDGLDASDYFTIGVGLYQVDEFEGAADAFRRARQVVPNHRDVTFNLAQTLYLMEAWEELDTISAHLLEIDALNELAYRFRANALLQLDRSDEAMDVYTTGEDLPIVLDEVALRADGADLVLGGQLSNHGAPAGTQVRLRFTFYEMNGSELGTEEATVRFEAQGEARAFEVSVPAGNVFGFSYRVMD
jgi:tetratricopeptide (TPR) repeat protein